MAESVEDGPVDYRSVEYEVQKSLSSGELHEEIERFALNEALLEEDRARFDRDVHVLPDDTPDTVINEKQINHMLGASRTPRRDDLKRLWQNSTPASQFRDQAFHASSKQRKPSHDDGGLWEADPRHPSRVEQAEATIREEWKKQGIWNEKWGIKPCNGPANRWMHEEPPDCSTTSESNIISASKPDIASHLASTLLRSGRSHHAIKSQEATDRPSGQRRNHDASRPFQQFIYQMAKEREDLISENRRGYRMAFDDPNLNSVAYGTVRDLWKYRKIWTEKWGTMPGMKWKHEEPFEMHEGASAPEQKKHTDDVALKCEPWLASLDHGSISTDAEPVSPADTECPLSAGQQQLSPADEKCALPDETKRIPPANAEPSAPKRGQTTRKRQATTDKIVPRAPKRSVFRKARSNISNSCAGDTKNASMHGQENRNPHIRRSKRLTDRASSSK
ncbi:hypothetical protein N7452_003356 [Penicillium brevicompactum]|uniref:Uncharacterized protein n=1 Tax=Penicillium brevicompactum TaxID=5074 RepID=A0A9W9UJW7_PENBR|nr:hypothetical protein N7452_003356 [Penicillium brevicompactum]